MVDSGPVPPINPSVLATDLLLGSGAARRFTDVALRFRHAHEPRRMKQCEVRRVPPVSPTCDIALRHRSGEARRLSDGPVSQQTAATATRNRQLFVVDVTTTD